jgi:hypothetical protein
LVGLAGAWRETWFRAIARRLIGAKAACKTLREGEIDAAVIVARRHRMGTPVFLTPP